MLAQRMAGNRQEIIDGSGNILGAGGVRDFAGTLVFGMACLASIGMVLLIDYSRFPDARSYPGATYAHRHP